MIFLRIFYDVGLYKGIGMVKYYTPNIIWSLISFVKSKANKSI
jgi:hypothetical protein